VKVKVDVLNPLHRNKSSMYMIESPTQKLKLIGRGTPHVYKEHINDIGGWCVTFQLPAHMPSLDVC